MEQEIEFGRGLNFVVGRNGAGKTSVLEALYVLAKGRSFRVNRLARIARTGLNEFRIAGSLIIEGKKDNSANSAYSVGPQHQVGLVWSRGGKQSRLDGRWLQGHWDIARRFPVLSVHADSFELLMGAPEERRRLLDWGAFYLDDDFPEIWQAWQRAHEQRNAALRVGSEDLARRFEDPAAVAGERLTLARRAFLTYLMDGLNMSPCTQILSELAGSVELRFRCGWSGESLAEAYRLSRSSDVERGFGQVGPQKADVEIRLCDRAIKDASRGEQKRLLHALVISQGLVLRKGVGSDKGWVQPLLLLDDARAELDAGGIGGIVAAVGDLGWQSVITVVEGDSPYWSGHGLGVEGRRFKVVDGIVSMEGDQ